MSEDASKEFNSRFFIELAKKGSVIWNSWRKGNPDVQVIFEYVDFTKDENSDISFADFDFGSNVNFGEAVFGHNVGFTRDEFGGGADFKNTTFGDGGVFQGRCHSFYA